MKFGWQESFSRIIPLLTMSLAVSFLLLIQPVQLIAASPGDIVINEIAWMGTQASSSDEWIELKNDTSSTIDLTEWMLIAADDTPRITPSGKILANSFCLLERIDGTTVDDITADQVYTGALENGGKHLILKDVDKCKKGSARYMSRKNGG